APGPAAEVRPAPRRAGARGPHWRRPARLAASEGLDDDAELGLAHKKGVLPSQRHLIRFSAIGTKVNNHVVASGGPRLELIGPPWVPGCPSAPRRTGPGRTAWSGTRWRRPSAGAPSAPWWHRR